jgi:Uma2 family endonuclease
MSVLQTPIHFAEPARPDVPPLESGDHLSRREFHRRYEAMPDVKKAELLDGVVYMGSPVSIRRHASPHARAVGVLIHYVAKTPGVDVADNGTLQLDEENEVQPDAMVFLPPGKGSLTIEGEYASGRPELIVEVASSSVAIDVHRKKRVYQRHGVQEYLVWRVRDSEIDLFRLHEGVYQQATLEDGLLKIRQLPGLWLDPAALIRGDLPKALEAIDRGVASPEHAVFVEKIGPAPAG